MKKTIQKLATLTTIAALGVFSLGGCGKAEPVNTNGTGSTENTVIKEKTVIKAETFGLPAPFIVTQDDGSLDGYDIAVLNALFELDSFQDYELDLQISKSALIDAQQGLIDFTVNNWSYNKDRAESYYFSYPYTKARYSIITAKGQPIDSFEKLAESGIAVFGSAGGNTTNALERWNENNPEKQIKIEYTSEDLTAQLQKIAVGGYAGIGDDPVWAEYEKAYPELFTKLEQTGLSDEETANITEHTTSHILFGKNAPHSKEYQKLFSEGIYELYKNGTLQKLSQQYIGSTTSVVPDEKDFEYLN